LILNNTILSVVSSKAVIINIVSPPGGTDFDAAKRLRIKALLAPELPGKVAPKKAGQMLAKVLPRLLLKNLV